MRNAEFVYRMEQVLDVYERPYDALHPVVCLDESPRQLVEIKHYRHKDGTLICDSDYIRCGAAEIYLAFEPLSGRRYCFVEDDHRSSTWVRIVAFLLEGPYRECERMTLVEDNLASHKPSAFYEHYPPEKAKAYLDRIEHVPTPAHGSWLDMAEIELSVLQRQCLRRHFSTKQELTEQVKAWQQRRNQEGKKAAWQFTTKEARIKLAKLYPTT